MIGFHTAKALNFDSSGNPKKVMSKCPSLQPKIEASVITLLTSPSGTSSLLLRLNFWLKLLQNIGVHSEGIQVELCLQHQKMNWFICKKKMRDLCNPSVLACHLKSCQKAFCQSPLYHPDLQIKTFITKIKDVEITRIKYFPFSNEKSYF